MDTLITCTTVLLSLGAVLAFLHVHLTSTKAWRKQLLDDVVKQVTTTMQPLRTDIDQVNKNQLILDAEFKALKSARGMQAGMFPRPPV